MKPTPAPGPKDTVCSVLKPDLPAISGTLNSTCLTTKDGSIINMDLILPASLDTLFVQMDLNPCAKVSNLEMYMGDKQKLIGNISIANGG
jgi:hypothetical protein